VLTPEQRSQHARMAVLTRYSREDGRSATEPARAAGPGRMRYWLDKVDPEGLLPEAERERRAIYARRAWYAALALRSSRVRAERKQHSHRSDPKK
jgi:hypothetical protein